MTDPELIKARIREAVDHYAKATSISCSILDMQKKELDVKHCKLCMLLSGSQDQCMQTHLYSATLAERFGGSYIYFCHFSLLYWVSPVIVDGRMEYAIIAGPVHVLDEMEALEEISILSDTLREEVEGVVNSFPRLDIHRVHSLAEILRMCSGWTSGYADASLLENREILQMQSRISDYIQEIKTENEKRLPQMGYYPIEKEDELREAIQWGDRQTAQRIMNELLSMIFFVSGNTLERMKYRVMELISLFSRAAVQGGASEEDILQISYRCQKEISHYTSFEGMARWLAKILHQFTELVFASKDSEYGLVISQAIRYIRQHYREHISLEETAEAVSLSPNYFSHVFNEKMQVSFSMYVNRLRIEYAQRLLRTTDFPLIEIAGLSGFDDQSYFSKVFKQVTKLSPGVYRKRAGWFPTDTQEIHETGSSQ